MLTSRNETSNLLFLLPSNPNRLLSYRSSA